LLSTGAAKFDYYDIGGFMKRSAAILITLVVMLQASPAVADATVFLGANVTPENRRATGLAIGAGLLIVGLEFEYATSPEDLIKAAPKLSTGMGNVLLQTPIAILGFQPYATAGAGVYRERLGTRQETGIGLNSGAGVKMNLIGPLRLRFDYRVFRLGSGALHSPAHRVYLGLNLKF
jgi:hypothetical protein